MSAPLEFAMRLDRAATQRAAIPQLSQESSLSVAGAYDVQRLLVEQRLERGERTIGVKLGFTSRAKMQQMGVSDLIWGRLTSGMLLEEGSQLRLGDYIHPRVEPEIAFVLRERLSGQVTIGQALAAVAAVAPALEVIDSRYADFKFNLSDVIADNCSSAGVVIGPWQALPDGLDNLGVELVIDGRVTQCGSTAAILGHPARALVAAARLAADAGITLEPGWIVMAGAATAAEALAGARHARIAVEKLGTASIHMANAGGDG